jgi:hypothetical protein
MLRSLSLAASLPLHVLDHGPDPEVGLRPGQHPLADHLFGGELNEDAPQVNPGGPVSLSVDRVARLAHVQPVQLPDTVAELLCAYPSAGKFSALDPSGDAQHEDVVKWHGVEKCLEKEFVCLKSCLRGVFGAVLLL